MARTLPHSTVALFQALVILCSWGQLASGQTVADILTKWESRRQTVTTAKYTVAVHKTLHKSDSRSPLGRVSLPGDVSYEEKFSFLIDLENGWFRLDRQGFRYSHTKKELVPENGSRVYYNGELRSIRYPVTGVSDARPNSPQASDYAVITGDLKGKEFEDSYYPLFYNIGIVPTMTGDVLSVSQAHLYRPKLNEDAVALSRSRPSSASEQWVACAPQRLDSGSTFLLEYAVDATRDCVVTRQVTSQNSRPYRDMSMKYARGEGGWVLASWNYTWLESGKPTATHRYTVVNYERNARVSLQDYEISPRAGMVIANIHNPTSGGLNDEKPTISRVRLLSDGTTEAVDNQQRFSERMLVCLAVIVAFVAAMLLLYSLRSKYRSQSLV
jgi:hypothetical protein